MSQKQNNIVAVAPKKLKLLYRRKNEQPEAFPTFYPDDLEEPLPEDIYAEGIHPMVEPTIMFKPEKQLRKLDCFVYICYLLSIINCNMF